MAAGRRGLLFALLCPPFGFEQATGGAGGGFLGCSGRLGWRGGGFRRGAGDALFARQWYGDGLFGAEKLGPGLDRWTGLLRADLLAPR